MFLQLKGHHSGTTWGSLDHDPQTKGLQNPSQRNKNNVSNTLLFSFLRFFKLLFYCSYPNISHFAFLCPSYPLLLQSIPPCCSWPWVIHTCSVNSPFHIFLPFSSPLSRVSTSIPKLWSDDTVLLTWLLQWCL